MLFNSYQFLLVFLPAAIVIMWFADTSDRWRLWALILLSLVFYSYWDVRFLPLMTTSILLNWWAARLYAASKRSWIVTGAIVLNLAVLGLFKYTDFLSENLAALFSFQVVRWQLALPLGISFFTFHHIMYLVDLRRGKAPVYSLDRYALYICFFPQAIAGPMARWNEVIHQFGQRIFEPGWQQRCALGTIFIIAGLGQKTLLADPIGKAISSIYAQALTGPVSGEAWLAPAFAFQVFFDFSGYSDIAIGLALLLAIRLPINFDAPFHATSILEFWQRWHITLARFLRDYVFTPLSRLRAGGSKNRRHRAWIALLITMMLCGLWHGASWTFVLWGALQGLAMVVATAWSRYLPPLPAIVGWAATVVFFVMTSVFFRAGTLEAALRIYEGMAQMPTASSSQQWNAIIFGAVCGLALPATHVLCQRLARSPRYLTAAALALIAIASLIAMRGSSYEFVYFHF